MVTQKKPLLTRLNGLRRILILFAVCIHCCLAGESYTIPIEGYETKLQVLGQHVDIPETPVKVIKITKTIAVKIPVPYPVKVKEKVPYPVHVAKPYPVPVPQIIKVPHIVKVPQKSGHDGGWHGGADEGTGNSGDFGGNSPGSYTHEGNTGFGGHSGQDFSRAYQVHEQDPASGSGQDYSGHSDSYDGGPVSNNRVGNDDHYGEDSFPGVDNSQQPVGSSDFNLESKNYDDALKSYFNKQPSHPNSGLDNHQVYNVETANIDHVHYGQK
ncbi:hypothetical protein EVAR_86466_1 [Eumeta japonica]|uniref:Uncharacterized protein n=1 Tax=Eumeta variegata TaxID=151549 RepID=A0A4C1VP56_EUMVA|nr:hypothetical protein EVAR_86466_1 [Eumeta japonica]